MSPLKVHPLFRSVLATIAAAPMLLGTLAADTDSGSYLEVLDEGLAVGATWSPADTPSSDFRDGGYNSDTYLYMRRGDSPLAVAGLSVPIRENPGPGEFRFLSFAWRKWGNEPVALRLERDPSADGENRHGANYDYTLYAGDSPPGGGKGLQVTGNLGGGWQDVPIDLWKVFGDFTITGLTFVVESRDAGFDAVALARSSDGFTSAAPLIQTKVADPVDVDDDGERTSAPLASGPPADDQVRIDWAGQIRAGGIWMYPLYACALAALVISIQRLMTIREDRLAPAALRKALEKASSSGRFDSLATACDAHPSTLADVVRFIVRHPHASIDIVTQTAGDIAARDIRGHLARIYPLSLISSISPLLGLLGTIIGMVEAFGIVALYGDEGGASILSDSISKALITTAAGLIIAIPCIAVYFTLKNRIMGFASIIEVEVEKLVTELYLNLPPADGNMRDLYHNLYPAAEAAEV